MKVHEIFAANKPPKVHNSTYQKDYKVSKEELQEMKDKQASLTYNNEVKKELLKLQKDPY
jgi:hypothetical protein